MSDDLLTWTPTPLVVDASVGFKWFATHEPGADAAARVLAEHGDGHVALMVPEHMLIEITHALGRRQAGDELATAIDALFDFELFVIPLDRDLLREAARISTEERIALYDAVYVALAARFDAELVTADARQAATRSCRVKLIT
ncbi:MAG: type II toxin-antitoxin system VapC family toxin [Actinomycetota bacterium]|nr:type II toxin-antitoxin system VapC family toxin [Actinomycetota bacterium]